MKNITNGSGCGNIQGDYLPWDADRYELFNHARKFSVSKKRLCYFDDISLVPLGATDKNQADAMHMCNIIDGSTLPVFQTDEEIEEFDNLCSKWDLVAGYPGKYWNILTGHQYLGQNKTYLNLYSKQTFNTTTDIAPANQLQQNEILMVKHCRLHKGCWGPGLYWYLYPITRLSTGFTCLAKKPMIEWKVTGMCRGSVVWHDCHRCKYLIFYMAHKKNENATVFYSMAGYSQRTIEYNDKTGFWEYREAKDDGAESLIFATIKSDLNGLALGSNEWIIYNDRYHYQIHTDTCQWKKYKP